jgi:hypothetical protein
MDGIRRLTLRNKQFVKPLCPRKISLEDRNVSGERLLRPPTTPAPPWRSSPPQSLPIQQEQLEKLPRFEEILEQSDNTSNSGDQLAEIVDSTDDLGQDVAGGPVQDEVGLDDDDQSGQIRDETELGGDEEGVGDARPVRRRSTQLMYMTSA